MTTPTTHFPTAPDPSTRRVWAFASWLIIAIAAVLAATTVRAAAPDDPRPSTRATSDIHHAESADLAPGLRRAWADGETGASDRQPVSAGLLPPGCGKG